MCSSPTSAMAGFFARAAAALASALIEATPISGTALLRVAPAALMIAAAFAGRVFDLKTTRYRVEPGAVVKSEWLVLWVTCDPQAVRAMARGATRRFIDAPCEGNGRRVVDERRR